MSEAPLLLDTVVVSNFLLADASGLLLEVLAGRGVVTSEVLDELAAGRRAGYARLADIDGLLADEPGKGLRTVALRAAERGTYLELIASLGRGEASCIAVAVHRDGVFASDDRVARAAARLLGVAVTGTIGLLVTAARRGLVEVGRADEVLGQMIAHGFHSPLRTIRGLLE